VVVAADAIEHHGAARRGVEFRPSEPGRARHQRVLPDPEDFIDGVDRVDLELVVGVPARDEEFDVVLFPDARIALGQGAAYVLFLSLEPEIQALVVPEQGAACIERRGLARDDVDEARRAWCKLPGAFVELAIQRDGPAARKQV
jgi:hypothetical protein